MRQEVNASFLFLKAVIMYEYFIGIFQYHTILLSYGINDAYIKLSSDEKKCQVGEISDFLGEGDGQGFVIVWKNFGFFIEFWNFDLQNVIDKMSTSSTI